MAQANIERDGLALLRDPRSLLEKAHRERDRFARAPNALEQLDHFYNFCVTAHSIKEYVDPGEPRNDALRARWNRECPRLGVIQAIANLSKHAKPRVGPLRAVRFGYEVTPGPPSMREVTIARTPFVVVDTTDGDELDGATVMEDVLAFWSRELGRSPDP